jgi:DNA-directed RNA polymerase specialized sigma24 family protein
MHPAVTNAKRDLETNLLDQLDGVYNFARWVVGHPADAERVTVEVMLQTLRNHPHLAGTLKTWLLNEMRIASIRQLRSNSLHGATGGQLQPGAQTFVDLVVPPRAKSSIGARATGTELSASEVEMLRRTIAELSLEHREVILLRDTEQLSYRDTTGILGVSQATMMTRLWRARDAVALGFLGTKPPLAPEHEGAPALIDSYIDAEVDIVSAAAFVEHVAHCRDCAGRLLDRNRLVQQIRSVTACCAPARLRGLVQAYSSVEMQRRRRV